MAFIKWTAILNRYCTSYVFFLNSVLKVTVNMRVCVLERQLILALVNDVNFYEFEVSKKIQNCCFEPSLDVYLVKCLKLHRSVIL